MPKVVCTSCSQRLDAEESLVGQSISCPTCGELVEVVQKSSPSEQEDTNSAQSSAATQKLSYLLPALTLGMLAAIATQSVRLEMKIDEMEDGMSNLKQTLGVGSLSSGLGSIGSDLSSIQSDVGGIQSDLSRIESDVSSLASELTELKDGMGVGSFNGYTSMSSLKQDMDQIQSDIGSIQSDISSLQGDASGIESDLSSMLSDVRSIESDMSSIKRDLMFSR